MILNSSNPFNMGRILENFVADELTSKNFDLYYYDSKSNGEVDFVISSGEAVIPLEVITYIPWYMTMFIEKPVQTINVNLPDFSSMKVPEK